MRLQFILYLIYRMVDRQSATLFVQLVKESQERALYDNEFFHEGGFHRVPDPDRKVLDPHGSIVHRLGNGFVHVSHVGLEEGPVFLKAALGIFDVFLGCGRFHSKLYQMPHGVETEPPWEPVIRFVFVTIAILPGNNRRKVQIHGFH